MWRSAVNLDVCVCALSLYRSCRLEISPPMCVCALVCPMAGVWYARYFIAMATIFVI